MSLADRNNQAIERALREASVQRTQRVAGQFVRASSFEWVMIEITGATATGVNDTSGNAVQWTYSAEEIEKASAGYGGWQTKSGGWSGTAYNAAEDENASGSRQKSTGVDHGGTDYPTTWQMQPIQTGAKIEARLVKVGSEYEAWFGLANGEDGTCS